MSVLRGPDWADSGNSVLLRTVPGGGVTAGLYEGSRVAGGGTKRIAFDVH